MMKRKIKIAIAVTAVAAVLAFSYFVADGKKENVTMPETPKQTEIQETVEQRQETETMPSKAEQPAESENEEVDLPQQTQTPQSEIVEDVPMNESTPQPQESESKNVCMLSVTCASVLNNMDKLTAPSYIIPTGGVMLAPCEIEVNEGESVFDVLVRAAKEKNIRVEHNGSSALKNAYIEGIGNLYEFDCGSSSGWLYKVNGEFQSVGCSNVMAHMGDVIEFLYTCDMGYDVGGGKL